MTKTTAMTSIYSLLIAAIAVFAMTVNVYQESFSSARLGALLAALIVLQVLRVPRLTLPREWMCYASFIAYMVLELLWTSDVRLAMNTIVPALAASLAIVLFATLGANNDGYATALGMVVGLLIAAARYTVVSGFPLHYPADFSYNAIASMYLFGLFATAFLGCYVRRKWILAPLVFVLWALLLATTSIKSNLGVALGIAVASVAYARHLRRALRFYFLPLAGIAAIAGYLVVSNDAAMSAVARGVGRIGIGISVLQKREDVSGYSSFHRRDEWTHEGIKGWESNPVFGNGVEEFRERYGITSHSTVIDLLYNSGLIGVGLFYGMLWVLFRRVRWSRDPASGGVDAVVLAGIVCYSSMSLSGNVHVSTFFAGFVGLGASLLAHRSAITPKTAPDIAYAT